MKGEFVMPRDFQQEYVRVKELQEKGFSHYKIAGKLNLPEGTVGGWMFHGKKPVYNAGNPHKLTDYEKGFLEGLFDGEGCFSLRRAKNGFKAMTSIGGTNVDLLKKAQMIVGGFITHYLIKQVPPRKTLYQLRWGPSILRWLLPQLRFVVKEKQRLVMIRGLEILEARRGGRTRWHENGTTKEMELVIAEIRKANSRWEI